MKKQANSLPPPKEYNHILLRDSKEKKIKGMIGKEIRSMIIKIHRDKRIQLNEIRQIMLEMNGNSAKRNLKKETSPRNEQLK